jgi:hypothetical protein
VVLVVDPRDEFVDAAVFEFGVGVPQKFADVGGNADYFVAAEDVAVEIVVAGEVYYKQILVRSELYLVDCVYIG